MKAGKITEEQAKERMAALRKRISQSQSRSRNSRANSDNDRSSRGGDYRARLMKEYDKNGDGKLDIVASRGHGSGLIWYENPAWKIHDFNSELLSSHCLQVGDIDGDGDIAAVTCA